MTMYKGKVIYNPSGRAGEYSYWACNFYVGCSNGCEYCYCKKGILAGAMGQNKPQLKKFKDKIDARAAFLKEFAKNKEELKKHGLFFSFTTDPMLPETKGLTIDAAYQCVYNEVPVKILTKCTDWVDDFLDAWKVKTWLLPYDSKIIAFGFTLTGHDELEPGASTNVERIEAMRKLHEAGFKTWASIEPIIDFTSSSDMIVKTTGICDLYKIGLESGKKYDKYILNKFIEKALSQNRTIYFKDSLLKAAGISRESLPSNCVTRENWKSGV